MAPYPLIPRRGSLSLVLRLVPSEAAAGRLVGRVEVVETGEEVPIHDERELQALARRLARAL